MKSLRRLSMCIWILTLSGLVLAQLWSGAAFAGERIDPAFLDKLAGLSPSEETHFWVEFVDRPWKNDSPEMRQAYLDAHRQLPPVDMSYVSAVEAFGAKNRTISELTNEASYSGPSSAIHSIAELPFVGYVSEAGEGIPGDRVAPGSQRPGGPWLGGGGEKMPATSDSHSCPADHNRQASFNNGTPMSTIDIASLHNNGRNGSGVLIGMVDSGILEDNSGANRHNVFAGNVSGGPKIALQKDFPCNDNFADDELGHGTAVAGVCAGFWWHATENWGYIGAAPDAQLAIAKVAYWSQQYNREYWWDYYAIDGIKWCVQTAQVDIINLSANWDYQETWNNWWYWRPNGNTRVTRWLDWASKQGVLCFNCMANDFVHLPPAYRSLREPADHYNGVSVAACRPDGNLISAYSRRGPTMDSKCSDSRLKPDLTAPGGVAVTGNPPNYYNQDSLVACPDVGGVNWYGWYNGTSMSSAFSAGAAACLLEANPNLGNRAMKMRMIETATDKGSVGPDSTWGFGLLQASTASNAGGYADFMIRDALQQYQGLKTTDNGYIISCDVGAEPERTGNINGVGIYQGYESGDDPTFMSPDIFVDNNHDGEPDSPNQPIEGRQNTMKVRVWNVGDGPGQAWVTLYATGPTTGSGGWQPIGFTDFYLYPGQNDTASIDWDTPNKNPYGGTHWCLGATVQDMTFGRRAEQAPLPGQAGWGAQPPWVVEKCDNLASRNFNTQVSGSDVDHYFLVENVTDSAQTISLRTTPMLPQGWDFSLSKSTFELQPGASEVCTLTVSPNEASPFGLRGSVAVEAQTAYGGFFSGLSLQVPKGWGDHLDDCDLSDWTISTSGTGVLEPTTSHYVTAPCGIHMRSQGDSYAYGISPEVDFDLRQDYVISTNFMVPNTDNHWFVVLDNRHVHLVIDYYADLKTWDGSSARLVQALTPGVWYEIKCRVCPYLGTYDVYLDEYPQGGSYRLTSDFLYPDGNRTVRIGDIHGGGTDHGEGYWDDITISGEMPPFPVAVACTTDVDPIVIPPGGGSFGYRLYLTNNSTERQTFKAWIKAILPDNTEYHVYGPKSVSLRGGQSVKVHRNQNVPGFAPAGIYYYSLRIGLTYPYQQNETGLYFTKEEGIAPATVDDWNVWETYEKAVAGLDLPTEFALSQNHPNPFNSKTIIRYQLPVKSKVKLEVYNLLGQKVAILADGEEEPGYKSVVWDCSEVASGMYFYKLTAGDFTETRRMMLVK